jgi:hypothetical protein
MSERFIRRKDLLFQLSHRRFPVATAIRLGFYERNCRYDFECCGRCPDE